MRPAPRLGLLVATIALPLSAVLVSQILGERSAPRAPVEVRVGDAHPGAEAGIGHPATPPSVAAVRPLVVGEHETTTAPVPPAGQTNSSFSTSAGVPPSTPPVAGPPDSAGGDAKGKAKGHGAHPTPSHGPTPGANGSGE
jgi:hypothetical protein